MATATYETEISDQVDQVEDVTAKANSLREQFRPFIEEKSLRKLQKNGKMADLANLKFKVTQKYLNLKNRTNITLNNLINKVNNRSKFLDHYVPSNSFLFNNKLSGVRGANKSLAQSKHAHSAFSPAILQDDNTFKINSKVIRTISKENLDVLESRLSENECLLKQINDYRGKLSTINEILEEMEQVNQEVIIEEDQETVRKDECMKDVENDENRKLDEINSRKEKIENDLEQCMELYRSLKMELNAVLHKKNLLKAKANEQKRIYADVSMKLKNLIENNRREMNEIQRKIIERRERDLAIIKAFRIRKIELTKCLEEKENLVKKNLNLSTISLNERVEKQERSGCDDSSRTSLKKDDEKEDDEAAYNEYNLIEEFNPEMRVKIKYYKELANNYNICRKDTIWHIKLSDGPHLLSDEKRLENVEGVVFVDEKFNQLTDGDKKKSEIGDGYFSTLYQGKSILYKTENKKLIIKKFNLDSSSSISGEILNNGFKICSYLAKYPHKNIVELIDLYSIRSSPAKNSKLDYYLVEEYCLSSLDQFVADSIDELNSGDVKIIADGLANALFYLHSNGIAHQNVCPQSVQINERKLVKLGYIESCVICYSVNAGTFKNKSISSKQIMDKQFAAPELFDKASTFDPIKADVYSYGLILAYCYKRKPFNETAKSGEISEAATSLIANCLNKNADNRYSMLDVLTHCYFN